MMDDRIRDARASLDALQPAAPPLVQLRARGRRQQATRMSMLAVVIAIAIAVPVGLWTSNTPTRVNVGPVTGTQPPSDSTGSLWPQRLLLAGNINSAVYHDGELYADVGVLNAKVVEVTKLGSVASPSLPAGHLVSVEESDGSSALWLVPSVPKASVAIYRLDPATLAVQDEDHLPAAAPSTYLASPLAVWSQTGGMWLARGDVLFHLDPLSGAILGQITVSGPLDGLADGGHGLLYDSILQSVIEERDAGTGMLRVTGNVGPDAGGVGLSASDSGVWASYRTGMAGGSALYAAADLQRVGPSWGPDPDTSLFYRIMGTSATVVDGTAWVSSDGSLTCADAVTGAVRATERTPLDLAPYILGEGGGQLFGVTDNGLYGVTAPEACSAAPGAPTATTTTAPSPTTATVSSATTVPTTTTLPVIPWSALPNPPCPSGYDADGAGTVYCIPYAYELGGTAAHPNNKDACPAGSHETIGPVLCVADDDKGIVAPVAGG